VVSYWLAPRPDSFGTITEALGWSSLPMVLMVPQHAPVLLVVTASAAAA